MDVWFYVLLIGFALVLFIHSILLISLNRKNEQLKKEVSYLKYRMFRNDKPNVGGKPPKKQGGPVQGEKRNPYDRGRR